MYVFMENQARYWKSLLDLALIDLPPASNIDQKFFTNRMFQATFLSNTRNFFLFSSNSMATSIRTKARSARIRKFFQWQWRNNRVSFTILNNDSIVKLIERSLIENFQYENGVKANINDCWFNGGIKIPVHGRKELKIISTFLLSFV